MKLVLVGNNFFITFIPSINFTGVVEHSDGDRSWYLGGKLYRGDNLPAIEWDDGYKIWRGNGIKIKDSSSW